MNVLETVTCCVLALVTFAVFRKEFLKVKDVFVAFWIPQKRKKAKDSKNTRKESNKENLASSHNTSSETTCRTSSPLKTMENGAVTKEIVSLSEATTKVTEEREGLRIKSATLLPNIDSLPSADNSFENFTSQKLSEEAVKTDDKKAMDPFMKFSELLQGAPKPSMSPIDTSISSRTEEVSSDDRNFVKTVTETKHEVKGNTEVSFLQKEQETVSKSTADSDNAPNINLDAMDLNNLISETQKKLDSFRNGFKTDIPKSEVQSMLFEEKKTETTKSVTESKSAETFSLFDQKPFSSTILDSSSGLGSLKDIQVDIKQDLASLNGGLGYTSDESSYVTTETPFGSTIITKKKKMFSSSSFYEEPGSLYPTIEEQVEMARKIAGSLADDNNRKSKGANMFYKRLKKSNKWIHEGPEPSDESGPGTPEIQGVEPPTPDISQVPFRPSLGPHKLKLVMDSRHPLDANALRSSGVVFNEHNVISPDMCHGLVKDLHSPVGKGAALFAKRKKKSEEWVVDEEKVKALMRDQDRKMNVGPSPIPAYNQYPAIGRQDVKLVKTPWEAAMQSPYGLCDAAFARVSPDQLADTVIRAADNKQRNPYTPSIFEGCMSPPMSSVTPAAAQYDIYHAKAPKGWSGTGTGVDFPSSFQTAPSPIPWTTTQQGTTSGVQNEFSSARKMVFQNFNTVPRQWKSSAR